MNRPDHKFFYLLLAAYAVYWSVLAISPTDRKLWLAENILSLVVIAALLLTRNKMPFSKLAYVFVFIFLALHTYAAHHTYEATPFDSWLKASFHTQRSYYDRVVHFAFGLLWTVPIRELLKQAAPLRRIISCMLCLAVILSCSAIFEVLEVIAALLAGGQQAGDQYTGMQGDVFDSQKDMGLAFIGALIALGVQEWTHYRKRKR